VSHEVPRHDSSIGVDERNEESRRGGEHAKRERSIARLIACGAIRAARKPPSPNPPNDSGMDGIGPPGANADPE